MLSILPTHLESYSIWLKSQNYQTNTIRNYLFDLQLFFKYSGNIISVNSISDFISTTSEQNNASRHFASLAKFCQFALDQNLCQSNLFVDAKKQLSSKPNITVNKLLAEFTTYLLHQGKSPITVKNYQGDLKQFIYFCEHQPLQ